MFITREVLRDIIQNKNLMMFLTSMIFMGGILACFYGFAVMYCAVITVVLITLMYLRLFSVRKILIFIFRPLSQRGRPPKGAPSLFWCCVVSAKELAHEQVEALEVHLRVVGHYELVEFKYPHIICAGIRLKVFVKAVCCP